MSDDLVKKARSRSRALKRSVAGQIEYWAGIGEIAVDHPDLPFSFIQKTLIGLEKVKEGEVTPYIFGETANHKIPDHFVDVNKMVAIGSGTEREIPDFMLTRFACYANRPKR